MLRFGAVQRVIDRHQHEESRQGIRNSIVPAFDVSDLEIKGLQIDPPSDNHGHLGRFHPEEIIVVCLYGERFPSQIVSLCVE
jgi:hypothetical protein